ncbi:hypothetical protein BDN72DRAFT_902224 [Pluteus cervinus]|uniref:Uncharacterized protein n=1 Tax=Pluteus cervinus TaxID=181527 RepID=A0ACD3AD54_9AGAR|nr:hypothetical protein BDN72DRAFT_902224 [Pluteus cervinus]
MSARPYAGIARKLVLAFDVGTTVLDPGEVPEIKGVMKFPYQEFISGNFKVPSIVWYDANGGVQAIGAGAVRDGIEQEAEDGQWTKVEWFKIHLRPKHLGNDEVSRFAEQIPPLPARKTIVEVFADFFSYLYQSAKAYIEEHHSSGRSLWASVESNIEFVLSHPNGWEGPQQSQMRQAAILAGLIPDAADGWDRVHFVTEGEASLHFCISKGLLSGALRDNERLMVVDAGGGTIDISTYEKARNHMRFGEVAAPQCKLRGSIFVTQFARKYLEEYLSDSPFSRDVPDIVKCFDKTTKLRFRRTEEPAFIKFGTSRDNDADHNIRSGQLKLKGDIIATFFQSSIDAITSAILDHRRDHNISAVFLVGGFAASDWLFNSVQASLLNFNIELSRPDSHINKAVADGAVSYYVDHFVSTRVAKYHYGVEYNVIYNPQKSDHVSRKEKIYHNLAGDPMLRGGFSVILPRTSKVQEDKEFLESYNRKARDKNALLHVSTTILRYQGALKCPAWMDEDNDNFELMCTIEADTTKAMASSEPLMSKDGQAYFALDYDIVLMFGLTEFKAQLSWTENGVEKRSPARVARFKLHLRPNILGVTVDEVSQFAQQIPPLPAHKTIVDVYADYFHFLYKSSQAYIETHYSTGKSIWASVQSTIVFVLSHPNGWEGSQQDQMRRAAGLAGLVPDTIEGRNRIHFVTEGEASMHFCMNQGLMTERIKTDSRILVVDAGGGTIDISSYEKEKNNAGLFSEVATPECKLRGSIFVTQYARKYLEAHLCDSPFLFSAPDIARCFDKSTKIRFHQKKDPQFIKFGSRRDNDPMRNIRSGHIKLQGDVVATFFQSSVDCIVASIRKHHRDHKIKVVFLVGGFSASHWLFNTVQAAVSDKGIEVSRPQSQTSKAVADGAVSFYVDHFVSSRVSRFDYGICVDMPYDEHNADHVARQGQIFTGIDGGKHIPDAFDIVMPKNSIVKEDKEFHKSFCYFGIDKAKLRTVTTRLLRYRGPLNRPKWIDEDPKNFEVMCIIEADTSAASEALRPQAQQGARQKYFKLECDIVLLFGMTEFKAQLSWKENRRDKRTPARVIYENV